MKTQLYYFSATGNSLTTTYLLSDILGDCELIPVKDLQNQTKIIVSAERVGFIFPVYYGNMPWIVRNTLSRMVFQPNTYAFLFTTQRGHTGAVAQRFDQLLRTRGIALSLARGIALPGNSFISDPVVAEKQLKEQVSNVHEQATDIQNGLVEDYSTSSLLPQTPIDYPNNFRGITADETCIGCGICVSVCPMKNIELIDGHANIGDDCITCLSCFHWCPKEAIWMPKQEGIERRTKYHHPDITLDMIRAQKLLK